MTDRELLDHFSDLLISDPRLLSLQERELLSNLLQHTLHTNEDSAVTKSIARAVGETVAERMHEALGTSILQRLAAERLRATSTSTGFHSAKTPTALSSRATPTSTSAQKIWIWHRHLSLPPSPSPTSRIASSAWPSWPCSPWWQSAGRASCASRAHPCRRLRRAGSSWR